MEIKVISTARRFHFRYSSDGQELLNKKKRARAIHIPTATTDNSSFFFLPLRNKIKEAAAAPCVNTAENSKFFLVNNSGVFLSLFFCALK